MQEQYLVNIGKISIPNEFNRIFSSSNHFLISPLISKEHYFEMSGESMYYALIDSEKKLGIDYSSLKSDIILALKKRISLCGGCLFHQALSGNGVDIQLRSTNSAIRTLLVAYKDGFDVTNEIIQLANVHYKYYFKWDNGYWFCHDSSEWEGSGPRTHIKSSIANKYKFNSLTLNTHLDSLSTLYFLQYSFDVSLLNFSVSSYIMHGQQALLKLLAIDKDHSRVNLLLQRFDKKILQSCLIRKSIWTDFWCRIVHPILFKLISPTFFFNYGFIGRDLAVLNNHIDYHIVNLVDIARFLSIMSKHDQASTSLYDYYLTILKNGLSLFDAIPQYDSFVRSSDLSLAWLCELKLLLDSLGVENNILLSDINYPTYNPFILQK